MSILSSPQGTPDRVWSLVSLLSAVGGTLDREDAAKWLNPGYKIGDDVIQEKNDVFNQTLGAATSLGAVQADRATLRLSAACQVTDYSAFTDWAHETLALLSSGEKDAVVLEAFAWMAAECQRQNGVSWTLDWKNDEFADAADAALPEGTDDDGARRINPTKLPGWRRWLISLGLMIPMPGAAPYPSATSRMHRELVRSDLPRNVELPADQFITALSRRLPYLDYGRMYSAATKRLGHAEKPGQLSPLCSTAMRALHDEGIIELLIRGDAGKVVRLSDDRDHKVQTFHMVVLNGEGRQ